MKRLAHTQFARDHKTDGWDNHPVLIRLVFFTFVQYTFSPLLALIYSPSTFQHLPYSLFSMPRPEPHPLAMNFPESASMHLCTIPNCPDPSGGPTFSYLILSFRSPGVWILVTL